MYKTLGFFLIFIYSFFINTLNNSNTILREKEIPSISQIRRIEPQTSDNFIFKGQGERSSAFYIEEVRDTPAPVKLTFPKRKKISRVDNIIWKNHNYRGVALERNRVLRI